MLREVARSSELTRSFGPSKLSSWRSPWHGGPAVKTSLVLGRSGEKSVNVRVPPMKDAEEEITARN